MLEYLVRVKELKRPDRRSGIMCTGLESRTVLLQASKRSRPLLLERKILLDKKTIK